MRVTHRLPLFAFATALAGGCASDPGPTVLDVTGASAEAIVVLEVPGASSAVGLPDLGLLAGVDGDLVLRGVLEAEASPVESLASEVVSVAAGEDGWTLVSTDRGLAELIGAALVPSPLEILATGGPAQLSADRDGLWLAPSGGGVQRWRDDVLFDVAVEGLALEAPVIATGPDPAGIERAGIWMASGDAVAFLRFGSGDGSVEAEVVLEGATFEDVDVDAIGRVWVRGDAGLLMRTSDGAWTQWRTPGAPDVIATPGALGVWLRDGDRWWHFEDRRWTEVTGVPTPVRPVGLDARGRLLLIADQGLLAVAARRWITLRGLPDGGPVDLPTAVRPIPTSRVAPRSYVAWIDDAEIPVEDGVVTVDPLDLDDGLHELRITAYWRTGEPASATAQFGVGEFETPTWEGDIEPIYARFCTPCHAPAGGAHLLETRALWEAEFEGILEQVEEGEMPLNNGTNPSFEPLGPGEIQAIRAWAAGGFLP